MPHPTYNFDIVNDDKVRITSDQPQAVSDLYNHLLSEGLHASKMQFTIEVEANWLEVFRASERFLGHWIINRNVGHA